MLRVLVDLVVGTVENPHFSRKGRARNGHPATLIFLIAEFLESYLSLSNLRQQHGFRWFFRHCFK